MSRRFLLVLLFVPFGFLHFESYAQQTFNATLVGKYLGGDYQFDAMVQNDTMLYLATVDWIDAVSISDPANPVHIDTINWYAKPPQIELMADLIIHDGKLIGAARKTGIRVIDISDPSNLKMLASYDYPHFGYPTNVYGWNNYLYVSDFDSISVLDVSDYQNPQKTTAYKTGVSGSRYPYGSPIFIEGDTFFFVSAQPPSYLWDILEISSINENGTINRPGKKFPLPIPDALDYIYKSDSLLFLGELGFVHAYSYTGGELRTLASLEISCRPSAIQKVRNYLYVLAGCGSSLHVFDIHDIRNPVQLAMYSDGFASYFLKMAIKDEYVYIASASGLYIVRIDFPVSSPPLPETSTLALAPAYPNPFSGSATISYSLPTQQYITLEAYNLLGQKVKTLYSGIREAGQHTAQFNAAGLPLGMYLMSLRTGAEVRTQTVVVSRISGNQ